VAGLEPFVDTLMVCTITALVILLSGMWNRQPALAFASGPPEIAQVLSTEGRPEIDAAGNYTWRIADVEVAARDRGEAVGQLREGKEVFLVVEAGKNRETGARHHRITGTLHREAGGSFKATFEPYRSAEPDAPRLVSDSSFHGVYLAFKGATLTAKAFDRTLLGLGLWFVPLTAWLFAFSTIISWSYYGEQGTVYLFGSRGVMPYRVIYCLLVMVSATPLIRTEAELDVVSTLGTGVMLWANIPIMLLFGPRAMRAYHDYMGRLKAGRFKGHAYPKLTEVVDGKDVE
jgi:AGCS family alanine or glycine:cation symporter